MNHLYEKKTKAHSRESMDYCDCSRRYDKSMQHITLVTSGVLSETHTHIYHRLYYYHDSPWWTDLARDVTA